MPELTWGQTWPTLDEFTALGRQRRVVPVVRKLLVDDAAPVVLYRLLAQSRPGTFLLESAERDGTWSRWSFIGVSSRASLIARDSHARWHGDLPEGLMSEGTTIDVLASALHELHSEPIPGLPPLTGGLIGALGWDVLYDWEPSLRRQAPNDGATPDVALCLADDMVAVDHHENAVWLIANAINRNNTPDGIEHAYADAVTRLDDMAVRLAGTVSLSPAKVTQSVASDPTMLTPQSDFEAAVLRAKDAIVDGEVFQVVLSQRTDVPCTADPLDVYRVLRTINPSPYMYYLHLHDDEDPAGFAIVGSSPETLVKAIDGRAVTFPIAGSRPRGGDAIADHELAEELVKDPKEVSEHVMLVDLARNDLAKVCEPGSVDVIDMMHIKRFSHIMHMASTVSGKLRADATALDALKATFPAGTLSGAPKPRAIELIDELEPVRRGIYGGVVGYFDFSGNADLAIAIRTAVIARGQARIQAGAGIVFDSVPTTEYVETKNKAAAVVRAIEVAQSLG